MANWVALIWTFAKPWSDLIIKVHSIFRTCKVQLKAGPWFIQGRSHTRCGPYFGTTVEAVQCLTYQTEWNVWTCKKETKHYSCFGVWKHTLFWGVRGKEFLYFVAELRAKSQKPWKISCPTVLQLRWLISTWWDENMTLFVFSACYEILWNWFCGRKQTKKCKDQKRSIVFAKGALIGKSVFQIQRRNAVHGRWLQFRYSWWYSIKVYT